MARSPLWQVSLTVAPEAEEALVAQLETLLHAPVSTYTNLLRKRSTVTAHLVSLPAPTPVITASIRAALRHIAQSGLRPRPGPPKICRLRSTKWSQSWKRHFHPIHVGRRLLIRPSWSALAPKPGQSLLVLDPGLSFGTGHHPTTLFCLRCVARCRKPGQRQSFADVGCGSGILALAAARLGFEPVRAFDFDAEAVRAARANACRNRLQTVVRPQRADLRRIQPRHRYDLLAANLTADLLVTEARRMAALVAEGGDLILAGILSAQFDAVSRAFCRLGFRRIRQRTEKGWTSGHFRRCDTVS